MLEDWIVMGDRIRMGLATTAVVEEQTRELEGRSRRQEIIEAVEIRLHIWSNSSDG